MRSLFGLVVGLVLGRVDIVVVWACGWVSVGACGLDLQSWIRLMVKLVSSLV